MINLKKHDPVADAVMNILQQEEKKRLILEPEIDETGFHKAAHAAKKANQNTFEFQGKKYPVTAKSHAEAIQQEEGDCVTEPQAKNIAKKEVKGHEKSMHHKEELDVNDRTKDMIGGRAKTKQKDDVGPDGDSKSTKVRFHAGPKNEAYAAEDEKKLADNKSAIIKTAKPLPIDDKHTKVKKLKEFQEEMNEDVYDDLINEVMSKDASAGDYIHDFVHSDNPKFAGKSKAKRKEMALAAYYAKQRNEEYVDEDMKSALKKLGQKTHKALTGGSDEDQRKDLQRKMGVPQTGKKPTSEEVEHLEEGKMDQMSLSHLWHRHALHSYRADQGYGNGEGGPHLNNHAATAIENHVRKHHGNKVADDMVTHSDHHVAHGEYANGHEAKKIEDSAAKLRKKHGIEGDIYGMNHVKEELEHITEKNVPTSPEKWAKAKSAAKSKFAVYPSAYANGWASKKYKSMGGGWKAEEVEHVEEGWDDMVKSAQEKVKSGPKPNGGSGKKEGSRYGGSKQKDKPEHEMKEGRRPDTNTVPFVTDEAKPMTHAKEMAKKSLKKMRSEMLGKIAN